jgi:polyphosphate kinase
VPVDVVVRGICAIKVGLPGIGDNLRVRSILGRYLEHSRVFAFANDDDPQCYIGSADLMHRNLDRRVEALIQVSDPEQIERLVGIIDLSVADDTASWRLGADGWHHVSTDAEGKQLRDIQVHLMREARRRVAGSR